jgi:hypothetical protein
MANWATSHSLHPHLCGYLKLDLPAQSHQPDQSTSLVAGGAVFHLPRGGLAGGPLLFPASMDPLDAQSALLVSVELEPTVPAGRPTALVHPGYSAPEFCALGRSWRLLADT